MRIASTIAEIPAQHAGDYIDSSHSTSTPPRVCTAHYCLNDYDYCIASTSIDSCLASSLRGCRASMEAKPTPMSWPSDT
jgi:hypothetical protein